MNYKNSWIDYVKDYSIKYNITYKDALVKAKSSYKKTITGNGIYNNDIKLKPIFCRIGTKRYTSDEIINIFPEHEIYVEPFLGGASIFLNKKPSKKEIINDLDGELMNAYKLIKKVNFSNLDKYLKLDTLSKLKIQYDTPAITNEDKLYNFILKYCNTFSSTGKGELVRFSSPIPKLANMDLYKNRLKKATILNKDYKYIIKKYDSLNTLFYLDPPYEKSKKLYKHGDLNLIELEDILSNIKGKFVLSLNDSPNVRNIFEKYNIYLVKETKGSRSINKKLTARTDLLITNFI